MQTAQTSTFYDPFPPDNGVFEKITNFLAKRKKYILWSIIMTLVSFASLSLFSRFYLIGLALEGYRCLPHRVFLVEKGVFPGRGDLISFKGYGIPYSPDGISWTKIAIGVEGDRIEVKVISKEERERAPGLYVEQVDLNGMPVPINIQGYVYLYKKGDIFPQTFRVLEKDTKGRPLPIMVEQGVIPGGKYFVSTPIQRSYDSRYWGLVDKEDVIGKAYPII